MNKPGSDGMWDEEDEFYYDLLRLPDGSATRLKVMHLTLPLDAIAKVLATLSHCNRRKGTTNVLRALLPGGTHGIASRTQRHTSVDHRATLALRFDCKGSVHQLHSLFHADETKPPARLCPVRVQA